MVLIIHISGASGSGKTTLGKRLSDTLKDKVVVKDLDDLRDEFIKKHYGNKKWTFINVDAYQRYINRYIDIQNKPIIFVGLNDNIFGKNKYFFYYLHSQFNYFIDIDDTTILVQKCTRLLNNIQHDKRAMDYLINNNNKFIKKFKEEIDRECNLKKTKKDNKILIEHYKKEGYRFMKQDKIYNDVLKKLSK